MNKKVVAGFEVGDWSRWLRMSRDDFSSAKINSDNEKYYVCSYLCHQCVEKSLKALMIKRNKELIKTHDLVYLAKKIDLPGKLMDFCDKLSLVFIETKYGAAIGDIPSEMFSKEDSEKHLNYVKEILRWIKKNI